MTSPSSIFSFETLTARPRFSKAIAFALVGLALAEGASRVALAKGWLTPERGLTPLIHRHLEDLNAQKPANWLLGNSTLEFGVDDKMLGQFPGGAVKLPHGSATLRSTAAMLDLYLRHAVVKPKRIVVCISKDDLNTAGYRAKESKRLEDIGHAAELPSDEIFALRKVRSSLKDKVATPIEKADAKFHHKKLAAATMNPDVNFDGKISTDADFLEGLLKDFTFDAQAFADLAAVAKTHGLPPPTVVLMPLTDTYATFHDTRIKSPTYADLHAAVAAECATNGLPLLDFGDPSPDHAAFRDSYHLNTRGAKAFTARLLASLPK